jgi:hypothetical protein
MVFVEEGRAGCELISDSERGSRAERAGSCGHNPSAAAQRPIPWPPPAGSPAPPPLQRRRRSALSATRPRERCCGIPARVALAGRARRAPRRGPRAQDSARADEGGGGGVCKKQRGAKTETPCAGRAMTPSRARNLWTAAVQPSGRGLGWRPTPRPLRRRARGQSGQGARGRASKEFWLESKKGALCGGRRGERGERRGPLTLSLLSASGAFSLSSPLSSPTGVERLIKSPRLGGG